MAAGNQNRVVLDTSVHLAALISSGSSAKVIQALERGLFVSVVSEHTLDEMLRTAVRLGKRAYVRRSELDLARYHRFIKRRSVIVDGSYDVDLVPTDVKDNVIVAAALEGDASYIVSHDRDLLDLKALRIGGHNVVQIVRPEEFLRVLSF